MITAVAFAWLTYVCLWFVFTLVDVARDQKAGRL